MAKNKPKKTANKQKSEKIEATEKSEKPETVAETQKVEKVEETKEVIEAEKTEAKEEKAEVESAEENSDKKDSEEEKSEEKKEEKVEKKEKEEKEAKKEAKETSPKKENTFFKYIFGRKSNPNENILTVFHNKEIYGAILGEVFGTMVVTFVLLTLGIYQPLYIFFLMLGVTAAIYKLSGANLNPIITAGQMATRRITAIRGVLYILAQILGAWLGYLIVTAFWNAGGQIATLPQVTAVSSEMFWIATFVEFLGAAMIAFFYARAIQHKSSSLTVATIIAGGMTATLITVIVISSTFLGLNGNLVLNPAVALMYQILPTGGDNIGELLADIALALVTYAVFPVLGGIIGTLLSDITSFFKGEDNK